MTAKKKIRIINKRTLLVIPLLFYIVLLILSNAVFAIPPLPTEFYGNVTYYNQTVTSGSITAFDQSGTQCGIFSISIATHFGLLSCRGDDPFTAADEGPVTDEAIDFYYDGNLMEVVAGDGTYDEGDYKEIWIHYPPVSCGDNYCDDFFETCAICSADCGACPEVPTNVTGNGTINGTGDTNQTFNETNTTVTPPSGEGTGTGDGGTASGGGGASGGGSGGGGSEGGSGGAGGEGGEGLVCEEDWICEDWSICYINETQYRTCTDQNECGSTEKKPPTLQECIYEGTCSDGIQNGFEEGIDCGGFCEACPWSEENATCFDNRQNQGEEGIDCGGPCEKDCEKKKPLIEMPLELCTREYQYKNPVYWLFLIGVLLAIFTDSYLMSRRIKKARENEELDDLQRSKIVIYSKRNRNIFIATIIVMSLILISYYHYFSQCTSGLTDFLWVLIMVLVITPIAGYIIIKIFEYDEKKKMRLTKEIFESHHGHIKRIIQMHNDHLIEIENDISNEIYQLTVDPEFKDVLENYPNLKEMYKEMIVLYDSYKEDANPLKIEKELCQNMYDLINNADFVELTNKIPKVKSIYDNLVILYKQYEEKQKMYDELFKEAAKENSSGDEKKEEVKEEGEEKTEKAEESSSDEEDKNNEEEKSEDSAQEDKKPE